MHLEQVSASWLGFLVLALLRYLQRGRPAALVVFILLTVLQTLVSYYYVIICAILIGMAMVWARGTWHVRLGRLAIALAALSVALAAAHLPLAQIYLESGTHRVMLAGQRHFSLQTRQDFLVDPQSLWLRQVLFSTPISLPNLERYVNSGLVSYVLSGGALMGTLLARSRSYRATTLVCAATACIGVLLVLGPEIHVLGQVLPGPFGLLRHLPGIGSLRAPARLIQVSHLALSLLSGLALLALGRVTRLLAVACGLGLAIVAVLLALHLPGRALRPVRPEPIYSWMAASLPQDAVVLHAPLSFDPGGFVRLPESAKMYAQWYHRRTLVNGFLAFTPPEQSNLYGVLATFPTREAVCYLVDIGVTHVLVDRDAMAALCGPLDMPALSRLGLHEVYGDEGHQVLMLPAQPPVETLPITFRYGEPWNGLEFVDGSRWNLAKGDATLRLHSVAEQTITFAATLRIVTAPDTLTFYANEETLAQRRYERNGLVDTGPLTIHLAPGWTVLRISNGKGAVHVGEDTRWISYGLGDPLINGEPAVYHCE